MIRRTRKLGITIVLAIAVLLTGYSASAESIDEETMAFLKRRAPAVVEAIKLQGREGGEDLGEARERAIEVREMFLEEKEEKGEEWAEVLLGLEDVEAEIEVLLWRFKEDKIGEDKGEVALLRLLKKQIALLNKVDRMEIKRLQEETDEMEEELQWRIENPEVALRERFEETLRDFGLSDEDVEEEEMEGDEKVGPLYTPAPEDRAGQKDELHGITFDFGKGIRPTLEHYCFDCHDSASAKGDIDLESALHKRRWCVIDCCGKTSQSA